MNVLSSLEFAGTFVFGLNGGFTAMEAENLDLVGVMVLAAVTALGGGVLRDIFIGNLPPTTFRDWRYIAVALGAGVAAFLIRRHSRMVHKPIVILDAAGLALFCVAGTEIAFNFHLGPFQSILLGTITGVGGGTIRDVIIRRVPTVLSSGLYAIPAAMGSTLTAVALRYHFYSVAVELGAVLICFGVRMAGVVWKLNLPTSGRD
ncbi:MAG: TRIC cation channel family protein [Actinomycetota bacterium]|nr:TRIC cation channel family protein [Actinomycetota bacterium]